MELHKNSKKYSLGIIAFLVGFLIMVFEIYAIKKVFYFYPENSFTVSIALSSFLTGLGVAGIVFARIISKRPEIIKSLLSISILSFCLYGLFILRQTDLIPYLMDLVKPNSGGWFPVLQGVFLWLYLFIPALLIGGSFPILIGIGVKGTDSPFSSTAYVYFLDIIGGALGSLITGIYFIPYLGMTIIPTISALLGVFTLIIIQKKSVIPYALLIITGISFSVNESSSTSNAPGDTFGDSVALIPGSIAESTFGSTALSQDTSMGSVTVAIKSKEPAKASSVDISADKSKVVAKNMSTTELNVKKDESNNIGKEYIDYDTRFGKVLFQQPSPYGTITVGSYGEDRTLFINYRDMCWSSARTAMSLGRLTASNLDQEASVLHIGLGCGFTAQALLESDKIQKLKILEINPTVIEACKWYFRELNGDVTNNALVELEIRDGTEYLRNNKEVLYDAVVIDIEEPSVIQSSPIYTADYARHVKRQLHPDGIFALWAIKANSKYNQILYYTLKSVFPYVYLNIEENIQLYASDSPLDLINHAPKYWDLKPKDKWLISTLENRLLERVFSIEEVFNLPKHFEDPFVRKRPN